VSETSTAFRDTLQELIDGSPEPMDHPSPDQWLAYQRGELPAEEEARLQEHLARCRDCFDLAAGAAEFARPDEAPSAGEEAETAALWSQLRPRLDPAPDNVRAFSAAPRPSRASFPYALAATFFVALVGMTVWNLQQRSALETLRAPRANIASVEILAGDRDLAGREASMPAGGPRLLVFLPAETLPAYRLVIRDAATGREMISEELKRDQDRTFNLYLPEGLRAGRYRLELLDGAGKIRETHFLNVTGD
jgi:hypothetical protein